VGKGAAVGLAVAATVGSTETVDVTWSGSLNVGVAVLLVRLGARVRELTVRNVNCESRDAVLVATEMLSASAVSVMLDNELNVFDADALMPLGKDITTTEELPDAEREPLSVIETPEAVIVCEPDTVTISDIVVLGPDGVTLGPEAVTLEAVTLGPEGVTLGPEGVMLGPEGVALSL